MDRGRSLLGEHGSTSALLSRLAPDQAPFDQGAELLRPYLPYGATRQFLSVTVPPDFPTVATVAAQLWRLSGREPVDGVLRFDPAALARGQTVVLQLGRPGDRRRRPARQHRDHRPQRYAGRVLDRLAP